MLKNSLRLGKIFGIEIRLDYSWFIVFTLVTWSLSTHYFPMRYSAWTRSTYWIIGLATSLLFFISVLAHEISHSLVAKAKGIPVRGITLFIFGGAAQITEEPKRPRDEFAMALAGPATSIGVALFFLLIRFIFLSLNPMVAALATWLSGINLILALFNLIPGFPLDGGRVLRSIIWGATNNLMKATQIASLIGRGVAYLFIFLGIWMFFGGNWFNGLWIGFIGWFLNNAASSSYRQLALREMLAGHTASEVMMTDCPRVDRSLTIDQLVNDYILHTSRRCFPVVDDERVWGLVTLHHVKEVSKEDWATATVGEVMTPFEQLKKVNPDDELLDVFQLMNVEDVNQLPVVENGNFLGMIARDNVMAFIHARSELGV